MKTLTTKELDTFSSTNANWKPNKTNKKITATFTFDSHIDALTFIMRLTIHAQVQQHHPDIVFTYAKAKVSLSTHDADGLTKKDIKLAKVINSLYQQ